MNNVPYTQSETVDQKYTVQDAVNAASIVVGGKVCTDALIRSAKDIRLTLRELNQLSEKIVDDTLYWMGHYHGMANKRRP